MLRKDYIMRMVEQIQKAIVDIVRKRRENDLPAAEQLLDQASTGNLGLPLAVVLSQPPDKLKAMFTYEGEIDVGKCIVAGELFEQAAAMHADRGAPDQAEGMLLRSLYFYMEGYRVLPDKERKLYALKIVGLMERFPDLAAGEPELLKIVGVYEAAHKFDHAEDLIFELVDDGVEGALPQGVAMYERMLRRRDEELEAGGLPRDEVEQGLQELRAKTPG